MIKKIEISLCMIVKDEEQTLGRCLESVKNIVDEIILVDTGSKDSTKEIGESFEAIIHDYKWNDDFAAARNYTFSKATKEYILWLDGDDYFTEENQKRFKLLKESFDDSFVAVTMEYSLGRDEQGRTTYSLKRNRLTKREMNFKWIGRIHEFLEVGGKILHSDVVVYHGKVKENKNRNLNIFKDMEDKNEVFTPRDTYYYANELYQHGLYDEAIKHYTKFIDSGLGWIEDVKNAASNLIHCYIVTNQGEKRMNAIFKTFELDAPRADICCKLAEVFLEKNQIKQSIFWYKTAMNCIHDKDNLGIDQRDFYTWIPAIQLCVCYSNIGEYETAFYYNELCSIMGGNVDKVEHNRRFLRSKFAELNIREPEYVLSIVDRRIKG